MNGKLLSRIAALEQNTIQASVAELLESGQCVTDDELRQISGDSTGNELRGLTDADLYRHIRPAMEQLRERTAT